ncbi:MAG TPA: hypothetical protein VL358_08795 [Caulobacteraceae bacterium]|jgi:predicted MFS family arabinose efflux permease|nr:hypothetical protein [Caulobacteraceae bacterium]
MSITIHVLSIISTVGALAGFGCYIYGNVIKSRGDRRWHAAGLLFSTLALAILPTILSGAAAAKSPFNAILLTVFLLLSVICHAVTSLRGRRVDRRAPRAAAGEEGLARSDLRPSA